jgi:uncharacterized membrane protein YdjX (TVP38/TMEM64 family)
MSARKIALALLIVLLAGAFYLLELDRHVTVESLKENRERLVALYESHAILVASAFMLAYFVQTVLYLPGVGVVLSLAAGAIFGALMGTVYVVIGSTAGAVIAFLVSRTLLRDWVVRRFDRRVATIDRGVRENGLSYILFLRLFPVFPFLLVNLACGATGVSLRTYTIGTLLGNIPGTFIFCNAGASIATVDSVSEIMRDPNVFVALVILGIFSLLPVIYGWMRERRA